MSFIINLVPALQLILGNNVSVSNVYFTLVVFFILTVIFLLYFILRLFRF